MIDVPDCSRCGQPLPTPDDKGMTTCPTCDRTIHISGYGLRRARDAFDDEPAASDGPDDVDPPAVPSFEAQPFEYDAPSVEAPSFEAQSFEATSPPEPTAVPDADVRGTDAPPAGETGSVAPAIDEPAPASGDGAAGADPRIVPEAVAASTDRPAPPPAPPTNVDRAVPEFSGVNAGAGRSVVVLLLVAVTVLAIFGVAIGAVRSGGGASSERASDYDPADYRPPELDQHADTRPGPEHLVMTAQSFPDALGPDDPRGIPAVGTDEAGEHWLGTMAVRDGALEWTWFDVPVLRPSATQLEAVSPTEWLVVDDGVATMVDPETREPSWTVEFPVPDGLGCRHGCATVAEQVVLLGAPGGALLAVDRTDGGERGLLEADTGLVPLHGAGRPLLVDASSNAPGVVSLGADGAVTGRWELDCVAPLPEAPFQGRARSIPGSEDVIVATSHGGRCLARLAPGGDVVWTAESGSCGTLPGEMVIVADQLRCAVHDTVHVFDLPTGESTRYGSGFEQNLAPVPTAGDDLVAEVTTSNVGGAGVVVWSLNSTSSPRLGVRAATDNDPYRAGVVVREVAPSTVLHVAGTIVGVDFDNETGYAEVHVTDVADGATADAGGFDYEANPGYLDNELLVLGVTGEHLLVSTTSGHLAYPLAGGSPLTLGP